ncbi:MAG: SPOR domain-containing protein [Paludibacteraceae bacterium]|nr:SPOR domain-containing protein [Paludibacteraceae bacterium]
MKKFLLLLCVVVATACTASKYTPEMYERAIAYADTVPVYIHDTIIIRDTVVVRDTVIIKEQVAAPVVAPVVVPAASPAASPSPAASSAASNEFRDEDGNTLQQQYHIVLGVFQNKLNAQNLVDNIMQKGEGSPSIAIGPDGLYRVFYFSSNNESEARSVLADAKDDYPSAWLLNTKK